MSFSGEVKRTDRACQQEPSLPVGGAGGFLNFSGIKAGMGEHRFCPLNRRTKSWLEKYFTLVRKTYNIKVCITNVEEEQITGNLFHEDRR